MCAVAVPLQILGLVCIAVGAIATALDFTSLAQLTERIRAWWTRTRANAARWLRRVLQRRQDAQAGTADAIGFANDARTLIEYGPLDRSDVPAAIAILDGRVRELRDSLTALQEKVADDALATRGAIQRLTDELVSLGAELRSRDVSIAAGSIGWFIVGFALSVAGLVFAGSCP
jgi:hypothetical protein